MPQALCRFKSTSTISFSKHHATPKNPRELDKDYEVRTWRERAHYDKETGMCFIPANMISSAFKASATYMSTKIPGKGNTTYTKHIDAGVLVLEGIDLGVKKDQLEQEVLFVPADGKRGGSKRVEKIFPIVGHWEGVTVFHILDPIITEDVFVRFLKVTGNFIGFGRWRPRNGGLYGRSEAILEQWTKDDDEEN